MDYIHLELDSSNLTDIRNRAIRYILSVVSTETDQELKIEPNIFLQFIYEPENLTTVECTLPNDYNGDVTTLDDRYLFIEYLHSSGGKSVYQGVEIPTDDLLLLAQGIYRQVNNIEDLSVKKGSN